MQSIPFFKVCKLCDALEALLCPIMPLLKEVRSKKMSDVWTEWFKHHREALDAMNKDDPSVLFTLRPEALQDRDYNFNKATFERSIARTFYMTVKLRATFAGYEKDGDYLSLPPNIPGALGEAIRNDLGYRVERIMKEMGRDAETILEYKTVTVEEIEDALIIIAANNKGSSKSIKSLALPCDKAPLERLAEIYLRLQSSQAKWLTRMIFKNLGFVVQDEVILSAAYTSFPTLLKVTANFDIRSLVPIRRDGDSGIRVAYPPPQMNEDSPSSSKHQTILDPLVAQPAKFMQAISPPATKPCPLTESTASSLNVTQKQTQQLLPLSFHKPEYPQKSSARNTQKSPWRLQQNSKSPSPLTTGIFIGTSKCEQTPNCFFNNTLFILAPCISSHLWLTENLLKSHGATYITSLLPLTRKFLPKRCPETGRRVRKIALVESNRREQTKAFMYRLEKLNLTRSNGERDWIMAVDWRLLEKVVKMEKGDELGDIWHQYRVGIA
ncbi:hypothetical protein DSL72_002189 [Monilinia vaccinii-corymbosi]|uniref:DNA ligase ATP-dependent N-terminal domain-containing protein n=1 Tax=Monilinia vaccinii-corymbosi TaxID=61207 RepID=A0A8A3PBX5_9HELO|nr:hypothetical protein DSL72_002189 [Monilinia vaccinii-corymbosi]